MHYDPIKNVFMGIMSRFPKVRKTFYLFLDLLFLRQWYVKKHIIRLLPTESELNFYDAGAGFCQYSDFVLSRWNKSHVFALDLKSDYLETYSDFALSKYPQRFKWITADLTTYITDDKYDLIAAIDILEHIEDDVIVLENFYKSLVNGGKLIISTPSNYDEAAQFTSEHVRPGYAESDIKSKLITAGFSIKSFEYSYGKWGKLSWILSIKTPLRLLSYSYILLLILPIYYICLYPLIYLLMKLDISIINTIGNGIIIVAEKKFTAS